MKIKVSDGNNWQIEATLRQVNGTSEQHAFSEYEEIKQMAAWVEGMLEILGLPLSKRAGATLVSTSGSSMPNSYKGKRNATTATILRGANDWFLIDVKRATLYKEAGKDALVLTTDQDEYLVAKLRAKYSVRTP
ncbi:MAG: hypothetical protein IPL86_16065 [Flavobacteriales bacterium]|nr:hypothetical protein [Flavobacteriales bacterium]